MSGESAFRRIVIMCDGTCDILPAVSEAAALAARWGVALHGIYLEDENLRRLAELPFGQQVSLSSGALSEGLSGSDIETLSSALGAGMRRAVAAAAGKQGIEWSFGSTRDFTAALALEAGEQDMLIVEGSTRAFSGAWSPLSSFHARASAYTTSVLIRRRENPGRGVVIVLASRPQRPEALSQIAQAMAVGEEEIIFIAAEAGSPTKRAPLIAGNRKIRIEKQAKDEIGLARQIASYSPRLVILESEQGDLAPRLLSLLHADLLMLRF